MFNRKELKSNAKISLKANYWRSVLVALISAILGGNVFVSSASSSSNNDETKNAISSMASDFTAKQLLVLVGITASIAFGILLVSSLIKIFLCNPILVGCDRFFMTSREDGDVKLNTLGHGFKSVYLRNVGTMFLRDLFLSLWTLLFIIPGIIKYYSYRMVPYILADRPDLNHKEVIDLSRKMMDGNKWAAFVLDLSFIGWYILGVCTCGLVSLFYTAPYVEHTNAALYLKLKEGNM